MLARGVEWDVAGQGAGADPLLTRLQQSESTLLQLSEGLGQEDPVALASALRQGFGRLIRTRADRGIVAMLDRRIVTKSYGRAFLTSLPPARRIDRLDALEAWFNGTSYCEDDVDF